MPVGAGPVPHVEGVAPSVGVEDLFPRVEDLDRAARHHGQFGDAELQVEGFGLAAEGAAHRGLNDPYPGRVDIQHPGQFAVQVVGDLRRRPHGEFAVPLGEPDRAVGLDGRVRRPLEEVVALHHDVRVLQPGVHIAELELHGLGDVPVPPRLARLVDVRARIGGDGLVGIQVCGQLLVRDIDEVERGDRRVLVYRRHRRHAVAYVAHLVDAQRVLVRRPRDDAVGRGHVAAGHGGVDAFQRFRPRGVDRDDARVRVGTPEDLSVEHPGEPDVVGVACPARGLGQPVDLPHRAADDRETAFSAAGTVALGIVARTRRGLPSRTHGSSLAAAASTAS